MDQHPHLKELHQLYLSEKTQPFRKVHRMIDLFESLIKFHTVVILSEYVKHNKLSDNAKFLLAQGLYLPTLGIWKQIGSALFRELEQGNYTWLLPDFSKEFSRLDKALELKQTNVIALRNYYGHGATPSDDQCEEHIRKFQPFLNQLLQLNWLVQSSLLVRDGKVFLYTQQGELSLHPVLLYREEKTPASLAFFNDLKNDKIGLLNYPLSKYYREKGFYDEFQNYLPLRAWKKSSKNLFDQQIEELTESFKGREQDLEILMEFVRKKDKGYLSVLGNPGIGKSTLIAQFIKELRAESDLQHIQVIDYFIHRGRNESRPETLLNYLIQKTDEIFKEGRNLRPEKNDLWHLQEILFEKWRLWSDHCKENKMLILIDGLDEGVENKLTDYLPRENFENILVIYGSRPGGHPEIIDFWPTLPVEYHTKLELGGLSKEDIRALIYEVGNKYEIERESKWIDAVLERSNGYPLSLKLLGDTIESGSISLNDINALPKEINNYYEAILRRYSKDKYGNALLSSLFTLAAAKDELSISHLRLINKLDYLSQEHVGSTLREILIKNEKGEVETYQLFHETFRDFVIEKRKLEVQEAEERILDFCATWEELEGTYEQLYSLQHYASHLIESKKSKRKAELIQLVRNKTYIEIQKKVLRQFDSTKTLLQLGLTLACKQKNWDIQLETALSLVDVKYEEANEAPKIIEMVANGEIDLALQRIESFEGQDREGLERKFFLYMLCLLELTLLESKEKPFRKNAIDAILSHLEKHITEDGFLKDWNTFFPSYLMFLMACEWAKLGIDYMIICRRSKSWWEEWVVENLPYDEIQIQVLLTSITEGFKNQKQNNGFVAFLKDQLNGGIETALSLNPVRDFDLENCSTYAKVYIAIELAKIGSEIEILNIIDQINDGEHLMFYKCLSLAKISTIFSEKGLNHESKELFEKSLAYLNLVSNNIEECRLLIIFSLELWKQGKREDSLKLLERAIKKVRRLDEEEDEEISKMYKIQLFSKISTILSFQRKEAESKLFINDTLEIACSMYPDSWQFQCLSFIINELSQQGKINESVDIFLNRILFFPTGIKFQGSGIEELATYFLNTGKNEKLLKLIDYISFEPRKNDFISSIALQYFTSDRNELALEFLNSISDKNDKDNHFRIVIEGLLKMNHLEKAMDISNYLIDIIDKCDVLAKISTSYQKSGKENLANKIIKEILEIQLNTNDYVATSQIYIILFRESINQGKKNDANWYLIEAIKSTNYVEDIISKSIVFEMLCKELIKNSFEDEALSLLRNIPIMNGQNTVKIEVCTKLANARKIRDAIKIAEEISDEFRKSEAYLNILIVLIEQGKLTYALSLIGKIKHHTWQVELIEKIIQKLVVNGDWVKAEEVSKQIKNESERKDCWFSVSKDLIPIIGWKKTLESSEKIRNQEIRLFYIRGWVNRISTIEVNEALVQKALPYLIYDTESLEAVLQKYAIHEAFLCNSYSEQLQRLNQTLNIQWALDIVASFSEESETKDLSIN
jgi:hypothetical protein